MLSRKEKGCLFRQPPFSSFMDVFCFPFYNVTLMAYVCSPATTCSTNPVHVVSVIGDDFPEETLALMRTRGITLEGLQVREGEKSFFWAGRYPSINQWGQKPALDHTGTLMAMIWMSSTPAPSEQSVRLCLHSYTTKIMALSDSTVRLAEPFQYIRSN